MIYNKKGLPTIKKSFRLSQSRFKASQDVYPAIMRLDADIDVLPLLKGGEKKNLRMITFYLTEKDDTTLRELAKRFETTQTDIIRRFSNI